MTWTPTTDNAPEVRGLLLRYAAILVLEGVTVPTSVAEIADAIERLGVRVPERKGKWVSDALRCEHRKGRYVGGVAIPERTRRRARRALRDARRRVALA